MMMGYFRRPQLAGKNIQRNNRGILRGSIRRADADGSSAEPYFTGVSAGQTLNISIDGNPVVVTLTSNALKQVITDITTVMAAAITPGKAYDEDGAIVLQSDTVGGASSVQVTGGTAAKLLGFDTTGFELKGLTGDIPSSPLGSVQNPFGTGFPTRGENLNRDMIQRGMARLSANMDVLFADIMKGDAKLQRLASFTTAGDGTYITPPATTRIFTGGPSASNADARLSANSTKEELAPYFFIFDTVTKQPAASRVVAVTRGAPAGDPAYANATSWSGGGSTGNVLGVDLVKQAGVGITSITNGRVVEASTPLDATVVEGDLVEFVGATNTDPWSNNGLRWVIEKIIDTTHIILRPMSASELAQMGQSFGEVQPVVELNDSKTALQTFGTLSFHTGFATSHVNLIVRPPIPAGAAYEIWAAQPKSARDSRTWMEAFKETASSISPQNDLDTLPNAVLSAPASITGVGTANITVGGYYVRWHGRVCWVPSTSIAVEEMTAGYIGWDEKTCSTQKVTASAFSKDQNPNPSLSAAGATGARAWPLAYYETDVGPSITSITNITRVDGSGATITVGWNGDFPTLEKALDFAARMAESNLENSFSQANYPHFEIVLLNDVSFAGGTVRPPRLVIRGANPSVRLICTGTYAFASGFSGNGLILRDLTLRSTNNVLELANTFTSVHLNNVSYDSSAKPLKYVHRAGGAGAKLVVENCSLNIAGGIAWSSLTKNVYLLNSAFTYTADAAITTPQVISSSTSAASATPVSLDYFVASGCQFNGWAVPDATMPVFVTDNGTGKYFFNACSFSFAAGVVVGGKLMAITAGEAKVSGCVISGTGTSTINYAIDGGDNGNVSVEDCTISVKPQASGRGLKVKQAIGCSITCQTPDIGQSNFVALFVSKRAVGNSVSGVFNKGIATNTSTPADIIGNYVIGDVSVGGLVTGISIDSIGCRVVSNHVVTYGVGISASSKTECVISNNYIDMGSDSYEGISLSGCTSMAVSGNVIKIGEVSAHAFALTNCAESSFTGNVINSVSSSTIAFNVSNIGIIPSLTISGNLSDGPYHLVYESDQEDAWIAVTDNSFKRGSASSVHITSSALGSHTIFSNNMVEGSVLFELDNGYCEATGNSFMSSVTFTSDLAATLTSAHVVFSNNSIASNGLTAKTSGTATFTGHSNHIAGNVDVTCDGAKSQFSGHVVGNVTANTLNDASLAIKDSFITGTLSSTNAGSELLVNGCRVKGATTVTTTLTGKACIDGCHFEVATIAGNDTTVITGSTFGNTANLDNCSIAGCLFESVATDHDINDANLSGCIFKGDVSFTDATISACRFLSVTIEIDLVKVSSSYFNSCNFNNSAGSGPDYIDQCHFNNCTSMLTTCTYTNNIFSGTIGSVTFDGGCTVTGNTFSRNVTLSTGNAIIFANNKTTTAVTFDSSCVDVTIDGNHFQSGTTFSYVGGATSRARVNGNKFDVDVTVDVNDLIFSNNTCLLTATIGKQTTGVDGAPPTNKLIAGNNRFIGALTIKGRVSLSNCIGDSTITSAAVAGADLGHIIHASNCTFTRYLLSGAISTTLSSCRATDAALSSTLTGGGYIDLTNTSCSVDGSTFGHSLILVGIGTGGVGSCVIGSTLELGPTCTKTIVNNCKMTNFAANSQYEISNSHITLDIDHNHNSDTLISKVLGCQFRAFTTVSAPADINVHIKDCTFSQKIYVTSGEAIIQVIGCKGQNIKLANNVRNCIISGNEMKAPWSSDESDAPLYIKWAGIDDENTGINKSNSVITNNLFIADNSTAGTGGGDTLLPAVCFGDATTDYIRRLTMTGNHLAMTDHPSVSESDQGAQYLGNVIYGRALFEQALFASNTIYAPEPRDDGVTSANSRFVSLALARNVIWSANAGFLTTRNDGLPKKCSASVGSRGELIAHEANSVGPTTLFEVTAIN